MKIRVHGHRGARGLYPENTLSAFHYALEVGVDALELDLAISKDHTAVVLHDLFLNPKLCLTKDGKRLKDESTLVYDSTLKKLREYDFGSLTDPDFPDQVSVPGERVATLEEVFQMVVSSELPAAKTVEFTIEIKTCPGRPEQTPSSETYADIILAAIRKFDFESRVLIQSFDHRILRMVKEKSGDHIRISPLIGGTLPNLKLLADDLRAEAVSPDQHWIDEEAVAELKREKFRVIPWTANSESEWDRLVSFGVEEIITDYPCRLIKYLQTKELR